MTRRRRITGALAVAIGVSTLMLTGAGPAGAAPPTGAPVRLIVDTDLFSDADDAGALAVAHALQDQGGVRLLGVMVNSRSRWGAPAVDAINTWYGHGDVPVGALKPVDDSVAAHDYARPLAREFPHDLADGARAPEAVGLYRRLLAAQPDHGVVIAAIGAETNLADLLDSPADAVSSLTGRQLVARKVGRLVLMGGRYPQGRESNFLMDPSAAVRAVNDWPTPVIFSGFEIGVEIQTGSTLARTPTTNPVRRAYEIYAGAGVDRASWDQTAVHVAAKGTAGLFELSGAGRNTVAPDGANTWTAAPDGTQHYLVAAAPPSTVADRLQALMVQAPRPASPA
ncbi:MAG TPA: nucleoside hydrolase [Pseudonocardia sp.]|nr:nucleoside hydrolase [Pseudonocardia sp.]